jgi:translocation and assembly module TamB
MKLRRRLKKIILGLLAFVIVCVIAIFFTLRSRAFHHYVLGIITDRMQAATGGKVQIGDFNFHLLALRVDLYHLAIHGAEPPPAPALLAVDRASVNFKIISLSALKFGITEAVIEHPVVQLVFNSQGKSNLPTPPPSKAPAKPTNIFETAVGRLLITRGEIHFSDRKIPLNADLRHFEVQTEFNPASKEYTGSLGYGTGEIQLGRYRPLENSLEAKFTASPAEFRLQRLVVSAGPSRAEVEATLSDYANPHVNGWYSVVLSTRQMAEMVSSTTVSSDLISSGGSFGYAPAGSLLDSVRVGGRIASRSLAVRLRGVRTRVSGMSGSYRLERGNLEARLAQAGIAGGDLSAELTIEHVFGKSQGKLTASLRSLSLAALLSTLPPSRWARAPVRGVMNATAEGSWRGGFAALRVRSDATLRGVLSPSARGAGAAPVPFYGAIHASYNARKDSLAVSDSVLRTAASQLALNGSIGANAALDITARSRNLRELNPLLADVRQLISSRRPSSPLPELGGSASFTGQVMGRLAAPTLQGYFQASRLTVDQANFTRLQSTVRLSPSGALLKNGLIEVAGGRAQFTASVGLRDWAFSATEPVTLLLTVSRMPAAAAEKLANARYPVTGTVSAQVSIHGSMQHPVGTGSVQIIDAKAWTQPIRMVHLQFQSAGSKVQASIHATAAAGVATGNLSYDPNTKSFTAAVNVDHVQLQDVAPLAKSRLTLAGVLAASFHGHGNISSPDVQATISVPKVTAGRETITAVSANLSVANRMAKLTLGASLSGAPVHAQAAVNLTGDYQTNATFNTGVLNVGPLLAAYAPGTNGDLRVRTQIEGSLRGPLKDPTQLQGQIDIPTLLAGYQNVEIRNTAPFNMTYRSGLLTLKHAELKGGGTEFRVAGTAPIGSGGAIRASAHGSVDLHLLQILDPSLSSSGSLQINVNFGGSTAHPETQGQVEIVNAAVMPSGSPIGINRMDGLITFNGSRAEIARFTAEAGGGSITASGSLSYIHGMVYNLALSAQNVGLSYPEGVNEGIDAKLRMTGATSAMLISGQVTLDQLSLSPTFDLVNFASGFNVVSVPSEANSFASHVKLSVGLRSAHQLSLNNSQLNLAGSANVRLQGTLADPVIVGRASLARGDLFYNGTRFTIESGVVDFVNPVNTEPIVNVRVGTRVDQYALTVTFQGPFDRMTTTYTSDPPLPPVEIISLLLGGQTGASQNPGMGAESMLAQGLASQVSSRIQKLTGISSLTIDPSMGGSGTNPGARIAVQDRVTKNLYFTFSVDTVTTQDDVVQLEYDLSHRWSVQVMRDENGDYSLQIRGHKSF